MHPRPDFDFGHRLLREHFLPLPPDPLLPVRVCPRASEILLLLRSPCPYKGGLRLVGKLPCWTEEAKARQLSGERKRRLDLCVHSFNPRCKTRRRSGGVSSSSSCSCRLSASNFLNLFQPAAGCWALETVLAMAQPVRVHDGTCSRCAAAPLRRDDLRLEVCRTPRRPPPAMHHSQCSDRVSCARAAGSSSVSSSIIGITVGDRRHAWRRAGRARCTQHACSRSRRVKAATVRNGWPCTHGVEPLPGSCGLLN